MSRFEKFYLIFQVSRLQSVLIFSILNHPCSFMVFLLSIWYISILVKYYFQISSDLKLCVAKITRNAVTEFFFHNKVEHQF